MSDRHVRRSGDDYAQAFFNLLPQGLAWQRNVRTTLSSLINGLTGYWGTVDGRAADLLERESDPRLTFEMLTDWERNWGLPDECFPDATGIAERQKMLVLKMTWRGGQSRAYFESVMEFLGFEITIEEFAPFMAGVSEVGDTRPQPLENFRWYIGPTEMRFCWSVRVGEIALTWFRASNGQAGIDPHLRITVPQNLVCLLNRWKPAHTTLVFDFSGLGFSDPMSGTP